MRIAYIITRMDELGGPQIHIRDFALRLISLGHEVFVISGTAGPMIDFLESKGVPCTIVPQMTRAIGFAREFSAMKSVYDALRVIRPDLVSCHSSKAGVVGRLAAWMAGVPAIFTVHGWAFTENVPPVKRYLYRGIEWIMARFCARLITVSEYDRRLGLAAHVAPPDKIQTIHNGMPDYPRMRVAALDAAVRLIMVARFAAQKDHKTLIEALARLKDLSWTLSLVGNGDTAAVREQVQALGLSERVHVLGQRSDVGDLLNASDIFLLITHWEGFPRSIVEAMRAGLPTIATAVAGVPESVQEGETGRLVPHQDVDAVAAAIADLIRHPDKRARMGEKARQVYEQEFTFDHMFDRTLVVYGAVTGQAIHPQAPVDKQGLCARVT